MQPGIPSAGLRSGRAHSWLPSSIDHSEPEGFVRAFLYGGLKGVFLRVGLADFCVWNLFNKIKIRN